jgi:CheY-like chemotaxis protein
VTSAIDFVAAERALAEEGEAFDLLLVDYDLAVDDGVAMAIRRLRVLPRSSMARVVIFSANRLPMRELSALGADAAAFKPLRPAAMLESLVRALTGSAGAGQLLPVASVFDPHMADRLPLRLLLADDNAVNLKVGSMLLKRFGYVADVAANGFEVLRALETKTYDLVLLDVQMPEMDGYEAARRVRAKWGENEQARPRLVAMTGNAMQGDREKCLEAGMDDYISKPIRLDDLRSALERWGARRMATA